METIASKPKLHIHNNYIKLELPIGNFTAYRSCSKRSGELSILDGEKIERYIRKSGKSVEEYMTELTNPKILSNLIPNWNKPKNNFKVGKVVKFKKHDYPGTYEIIKIEGYFIFLNVLHNKKLELIGFHSSTLKTI